MVINADDRFAELSNERQKAILARTEAIIKEMTLAELRKACKQSQATIAKELGIKQAAVSRVERRADMRVSTLREIVEALGGTLKIIAQFPGRHDVSVNLVDVMRTKTNARKVAKAKVPVGRTATAAISPPVRGRLAKPIHARRRRAE
jgi:transcriptional regulator with XRE-family HTH domain